MDDMRTSTCGCADLLEDDIYRRYPGIRLEERNICLDDPSVRCIGVSERTACDRDWIDTRLVEIERAYPNCAVGRTGYMRRRSSASHKSNKSK